MAEVPLDFIVQAGTGKVTDVVRACVRTPGVWEAQRRPLAEESRAEEAPEAYGLMCGFCTGHGGPSSLVRSPAALSNLLPVSPS